MKIFKLLTFLAIVHSFLTINIFAEPQNVIVVLGDKKNEDNKTSIGHVYDELSTELIVKAGFNVEISYFPWKRALRYLESGDLAMIPFLSKTKEREVYVDFIGISIYEQAGLLVRTEDVDDYSDIKSLHDLRAAKKICGAQENVFYSTKINQELDELKGEPELIQYTVKIMQNISKVFHNHINCTLVENINQTKILLKINKYNDDLTVITLPIAPSEPVYFGVSKKLPIEEREKIKQAYIQLKKEKKFKAILSKWLD